MPRASRIMIGVCGLLCFIDGYDFVRNDLSWPKQSVRCLHLGVERSHGSASVPDSIGVLARLAVKEAQLLECLSESVFAGHGRFSIRASHGS
jgi:hypothetical protein